MWSRKDLIFFRRVLLEWFDNNGREFPWRRQNLSSYEIIISEILLQRTKAETVAKYYPVFFNKYPGWDELKDANIQDLEVILKPLGLYKHRANRLYRIIQEYNQKEGRLPRNREELNDSSLSTLYVSNAYELFLLNRRAPLLDVNMSRLLGRFFNPGEFKDVRNDKQMQELSRIVINVTRCRELNWAILDYAALVCKKTTPRCTECKLNTRCRYYKLLTSIVEENKEIGQPRFHVEENEKIPDYPVKPLKVLSLFSGCGGMDLGFEGDFLVHADSVNESVNPDFVKEFLPGNFVRLNPARFQTVFANDILFEAKKAWINYFGKKGISPEVYHVESIVDLVKQHRLGVKIFPEHVDIVTGGFPCQDFSVAGKRRGLNSHKDHTGKIIMDDIPTVETRGQLYMWLKEVVEITRPNIFIAENVKGLVNLANVKEIIQRDFANANKSGYLVLDPLVLQAADYGVPQSRERVIFIGIKKSALNHEAMKALSGSSVPASYNPYPRKSHAYTADDPELKLPVTLDKILMNMPEPEQSGDPSQKYFSKAKFMGKHCQGQTEINLHGISPTIRAEHHGNIEFRRLSLENGGKNLEEIVKRKLSERRLTPRECALIQTFPPDYDFVIPADGRGFIISPSAAYRLIGNAVPPLLAYHIAKRIEKLWDLYFGLNKKSKSGKTLT